MDIELLSQEFCDYSTSILGYSKDTIRRYRYVLNCFIKFSQIKEIDIKESLKAQEKNQTFFTPAISLIQGLSIALDMIEKETLMKIIYLAISLM